MCDSLYFQSRNKMLTKRYIELIYKQPSDERTAEEITEDFVKRHGLKEA